MVLGGDRSGKSNFAEQLAAKSGESVTYVATAAILDEEMERRVLYHKASRPGFWQTVEEPVYLVKVLEEHGDKNKVFLIDCLTIWLSNLMIDQKSPFIDISEKERIGYILQEVEKLVISGRRFSSHLIVVSNEVGMGIVPEYPLGRTFRDLAGQVNQILARHADQVYFVIAGLVKKLKGER